MTRDEARAWYVNVLLDKVRQDTYPSTTQMSMIEQALATSPQLIPDYLDALLDKVADDRFPSISLLERIAAVAEMLPQQTRG